MIALLPEACTHADCTATGGCRTYVASVFGSLAERHRRNCEARRYLDLGYNTPDRVATLVETMREARGAAAAEQLRADLRAAWAQRHRGVPA